MFFFMCFFFKLIPTTLLGNYVFADFFFKINFFEKFFQEYHQMVKKFGSRSGSMQKLSAAETSRLIKKSFIVILKNKKLK